MTNEVVGWSRFLTLASEDLWGVNPVNEGGSGSAASGTAQDYVHVPVTEYGARLRPENRQSDTFIGIVQKKHSQNFRGMVQGTLAAPLIGAHDANISQSLAQYLIDWAFGNHESLFLPSKTAIWAGVDEVANLEHVGLRVNQATVEGSEDNNLVSISMDVIGKDEEAEASGPSIPNNRNELIDFEFGDVTASIDNVNVDIESFSIQVQHNLRAKFLNQKRPRLLWKSQRVLLVSLTLVKDSDTYGAARRATTQTEYDVTLVLKGLHNGTSTNTYTRLTADFPRCHLMDVDEQGGKEDLETQPLNMIALKPDDSNNDVTLTWDTV